MAMVGLGRRFVNIVTAGKYRSGLFSVHRLDVNHLFYPSASEARSVVAGDGPRAPTTESLPAPCAIFCNSDATTAAAPARTRSKAFFSLVSSEGSRILFTNEAGDSMIYHADDDGSSPTGHAPRAMPCLEEFAGPVAASVSVAAQKAVKEESIYVIHGVRDGVAPRFHVLRFGMLPPPTPAGSTGNREGWYWQSLPPPPFVSDDDRPYAVISAYTMVEGGRTICVSSSSSSSYGGLAGTWCFDTVRGEWWHAGDWEMPFEGRAEYLADLDVWLGFNYGDSTYGELCTISLSAMARNQPPTLLQRLWRDDNCKAKQVELINLGSGRFAIAKVFCRNEHYTSDYWYEDIEVIEDDQILVVNGVEIRPRQPRDSSKIRSCSDGLELIHHKSIVFMCDTHRIHQVL